MGVLPVRDIDLIEYCETHAPVWTANATAIGLTIVQVGALTTLTTAARTGFNNSQTAREASKASTTTFHSGVSAMRTSVADLLRIIKGFAEVQPDPLTVYAKAQVPPPADPSPVPVPGKPTDIGIILNSDGSITLSWFATNGSASGGAFFNISRKLPGQSSFYPIGGAPGSTSEQRRAVFTDSTVPTSAGGAGAQYIITGYRGARTGTPSDAITVQFGVDGQAQVSGATLRMAA